MKTIFFIIGLSAGLVGQALAQTNQPALIPEATNDISSEALVTKSGAVYHKFRIEKLDSAGVTISYVLTGGGMGMDTLPLNLLPDDWQRRYGYGPESTARQPGSPSEVTNDISSDVLVTKSGVVYHKFHIERVDPAGLTISYVLDGGGMGIGKVPFSLLPEEWQWRYGYDPDKASKYDLEQKRAMAQLREQMILEEQAYRDKRAQAEAAEEAAAAQAKTDAETAQKPEDATVTQATNATNSPAITDTNLPAPPLPPAGP